MRRVIVVGAGAAGTMAAIVAASRGAETLLLECTKDGGRKILISGGGRCNILPAHLDESRFVTDSPAHILRRILRSSRKRPPASSSPPHSAHGTYVTGCWRWRGPEACAF